MLEAFSRHFYGTLAAIGRKEDYNVSSDSNDFVSILVPRRHVTKVYGLIASLEDGTEQRPGERSGDTDGAAAATDWPDDLIIRQYRESPESMKQFQSFLAEHHGAEYSTR